MNIIDAIHQEIQDAFDRGAVPYCLIVGADQKFYLQSLSANDAAYIDQIESIRHYGMIGGVPIVYCRSKIWWNDKGFQLCCSGRSWRNDGKPLTFVQHCALKADDRAIHQALASFDENGRNKWFLKRAYDNPEFCAESQWLRFSGIPCIELLLNRLETSIDRFTTQVEHDYALTYEQPKDCWHLGDLVYCPQWFNKQVIEQSVFENDYYGASFHCFREFTMSKAEGVYRLTNIEVEM